MYKFNTLQYNLLEEINIDKRLSLEPLRNENILNDLKNEYRKTFGYEKIRTFSFTTDGFFALIMQLDGNIGISVGECEAIVSGGKLAQSFDKEITWIGLNKDGTLNLEKVTDKLSYILVSNYIIDTFVKVDIELIKKQTSAKIVSNISATKEFFKSDILILDSYKLSGYGNFGILLYDKNINDEYLGMTNILGMKLCLDGFNSLNFEDSQKELFLYEFEKLFKDDLYLFVNPNNTFSYSLHLGFKGIKAREMIRALSLYDIFISNGEGCSLGMSKPSRVIQSMGYSEDESRWCITLDFNKTFEVNEIEKIVKIFYKVYRQIKLLNQ